MSTVRHQISEASEREERSKAAILSLIFHVALLALLYFYRFDVTAQEEPPQAVAIQLEWGGGGDDAAAGEPDKGMNDDYTPPGETATPTPPAPSTPTTSAPVEKPAPVKTSPPPVATTEDPNVAALRRQQEEDRKRQQEEARKRADAEQARLAELQRQEDARKAEEARRNKVKNNAGSAFGKPGGTGQGAGGGGNPGNGGVAGGTGSNPFGKSSGSGGGSGGGVGTGEGPLVGGGLTGRGVRYRPSIRDNSQDVGKIVVEVCVDAAGNVLSANYTLKGSTSQSSTLRRIAEDAARKFKFAASNSPKECGTIAFNFQLQ